MRSRLIVSLAFITAPALAGQPQERISVPVQLLQAIYTHLTTGGTYADATELARELNEAVQEPEREAAREADMRKKIESESAKPTTK